MRRYVLLAAVCCICALCLGVMFFPSEDPVSPAEAPDPLMQMGIDKFVIVSEADMLTTSSGLRRHVRLLEDLAADSPEVWDILTDTRIRNPISDSVVRINENGSITAMVPEGNRSLIGTQDTLLLNESSFTSLSSTLSGYHRFENGNYGVTYSYPVYTSNQTYTGYVNVNIDLGLLFSALIQDMYESTGYDIWVADADGTVLYDKDSFEIGRNLQTDPLYMVPALQSTLQKILTEPAGSDRYVFYTSGWTSKAYVTAVWKTISFTSGREWRVVLTSTTPVEGSVNAAIDPGEAAMEHLLSRAFVYAGEHGKEAALAVFNDPNGEFSRDGFYVFAYDMNGTVLALPYQQELVGINRYNQMDDVGVKYVRQGIFRAAQGGGYLYYPYANPGNNYTQEMKLAYTLPVDDTWLIGTGISLHDVPQSIDWQKRENMITQVRRMVSYAHTEGKDALADVLNNPTGMFSEPGLSPYAFTNDGTLVASPGKPADVGESQMGTVNAYGISYMRDAVILGKNGGGMMYAGFVDPDTGSEKICLLYIEPVDDEWFVGSSIPLI